MTARQRTSIALEGICILCIVLALYFPYFYLYDNVKLRGAYIRVNLMSVSLHDAATHASEPMEWHQAKEFGGPIPILIGLGHGLFWALTCLLCLIGASRWLYGVYTRILTLGALVGIAFMLTTWWWFFWIAGSVDSVVIGPGPPIVFITICICALRGRRMQPAKLLVTTNLKYI